MNANRLPEISALANEYATLDALLDALGGLRIACLRAPYPSNHARTLLLADPRPGAGPCCVIKLARLPSAETYLLNAMKLKSQLPSRFGRMRLLIPAWAGRVGGRLATIEPFAHGPGAGRAAIGALLRDWLALLNEYGAAIQDLATERIEPRAAAEFIARHRLGRRLSALVDRRADWFCHEPAFCHGDLSHLNALLDGDDLCLIDWDFARRVSFRRFDALYCLLAATMPLRGYRVLARRFARLLERHADTIQWQGPTEEALALILVFMAIHSESKDSCAIALRPVPSPFLTMLEQGWGN
jgi:hypothetical protein